MCVSVGMCVEWGGGGIENSLATSHLPERYRQSGLVVAGGVHSLMTQTLSGWVRMSLLLLLDISPSTLLRIENLLWGK